MKNDLEKNVENLVNVPGVAAALARRGVPMAEWRKALTAMVTRSARAGAERRGAVRCGALSPTSGSPCVWPANHGGNRHASVYGMWSVREHDLDLYRARAWSLKMKTKP